MFYFYELISINKSELSIIPLIVSYPKAWVQMNPKILAFHSSFRATTIIAICYNKHLQTFFQVIMEFVLYLLHFSCMPMLKGAPM